MDQIGRLRYVLGATQTVSEHYFRHVDPGVCYKNMKYYLIFLLVGEHLMLCGFVFGKELQFEQYKSYDKT